MGTCPNCGNKGFFLKTAPCKICGKEGCDECMTYLFTFYPYASSHPRYEDWFCHSHQCREIFAKEIENCITPDVLGRHTLGIGLLEEGLFTALKKSENVKWLDDKVSHSISLDEFVLLNANSELIERIDRIANEMRFQIAKSRDLAAARNAERAGRYEDAAVIYERYEMYDEAGIARAKDKQVTIKKTEVSVDLGSLLKQIQNGGTVVIYRCPHCKAPIKIGKSTDAKSLRICEHCKSEIEIMDIADLLRTALS